MQVRQSLAALGRVAHAAALWLLGGLALAALGLTALSALGVLPWLGLEASWGGAPIPGFGMWAQVGLTALLVLLVAFIPAGGRVLALERAHRDFKVSMADVARAYAFAHAADREGAFALSGEFDMVRDRLQALREHPDLRLLEADVLTLAAQMSQQSAKLAAIYSDERVARAKDFLAQRQKEAEMQAARIDEALATTREIMRWTSAVELEEATVASRLQVLDGELQAILPRLGYSFDGVRAEEPVEPPAEAEAPRHGNVLNIASRTAAE